MNIETIINLGIFNHILAEGKFSMHPDCDGIRSMPLFGIWSSGVECTREIYFSIPYTVYHTTDRNFWLWDLSGIQWCREDRIPMYMLVLHAPRSPLNLWNPQMHQHKRRNGLKSSSNLRPEGSERSHRRHDDARIDLRPFSLVAQLHFYIKKN